MNRGKLLIRRLPAQQLFSINQRAGHSLQKQPHRRMATALEHGRSGDRKTAMYMMVSSLVFGTVLTLQDTQESHANELAEDWQDYKRILPSFDDATLFSEQTQKPWTLEDQGNDRVATNPEHFGPQPSATGDYDILEIENLFEEAEAIKKTNYQQAKNNIFMAMDICLKALAKPGGKENALLQKWAGIIVGCTCDYVSTKERIAASFKVREHWETAILLNPADAENHHLLGRWHMGVASITWFERKMANSIFGEIPSATYEDALRHLELAENMNVKRRKKNASMLGQCYLKLGQKREAEKWFEKTLLLKSLDREDCEAHEEAQRELKRLRF